jgi:hypothetical protein
MRIAALLGAASVAMTATTASPVAAAEHPRSVADYTLHASLDPVAHTIAASGTLTWTNTSTQPTRELWFHLYLNGFKNQRSVFLRQPLGSGRGGGPVADWGTIDVRRMFWREGGVDLWPGAERSRPGDEDETDARIPLPRAVAPGETITLEMTWDDKLPSVIERTGYYGSFHFAGQWFPKIAVLEPDGTWTHFPFHRLSEFYADYGAYDVTIDVPEKFVVGATGVQTEEHSEGGRRKLRFTQRDIHDFAFTAWDGFRVEETKIDNVAVRSLFPVGYDRVAARAIDSLKLAIPHFGQRYGAYPYPVLTVVHPPEPAREAGGMEYPTLITTGGWWWTPRGVHAIESVTIHEFGHQYFYGLLASNENRWPFMDEGLNTYAEEESMGTFYGKGAAFDDFGLRVNGSDIAEAFSESGALLQPIAQPAPKFETFELYGKLVYARTATLMETLRRVYGPAMVETALHAYATRNRFTHPQPEQLLAAVEADIGKPAAENLRIGLFEKGWVDYQVVHVASDATTEAQGLFDRNGKREVVRDRGATAASYDGYVIVARKGTLTFPVDVDVLLEDGSSQRITWDGQGDTTRLAVHGRSPIRSVDIDPDRRVLVDSNVRNNFARAAGATAATTTSSFERLLYWAANFLEALLP